MLQNIKMGGQYPLELLEIISTHCQEYFPSGEQLVSGLTRIDVRVSLLPKAFLFKPCSAVVGFLHCSLFRSYFYAFRYCMPLS